MIPGRIPGRERWEVEDKLYLSDAVGQSGELKIYGGTAGEKAFEIFYGSTSIFSILATGSTVQLLGGNVKPVQIGDAGTQSEGLVANDDLFVSGKLEVDGEVYIDGQIHFKTHLFIQDDRLILLGESNDACMLWSTVQATSNALILGVGDTSELLVICDRSDAESDFDHAAQSNPTLFVHSATNPDDGNDEWISITHNQTDGIIDVGSGTLNFGGSTVNFVNSTLTGATVTHDAYVTLEVGGVAKKFMLGS